MPQKAPLALKHISATQLFAIAVCVMIVGHFLYFFIDNAHYTRIPDRILAPVFLIAIGYNAGHKLSNFVIIGAFALMFIEFFTIGTIHGTILLTIVLVRFAIEPLARFMIQNQSWLWGLSILFIILYPLTGKYTEYSTIALILGFAGWLRKNEQSLETNTVNSRTYFVFALIAYVISIQMNFQFNTPVMVGIGLGAAFVFYLMYNMKTLLLNSIKQKPQHVFDKAIKFIGHKSLEIYLAHMALFYCLFYLINL